MPVTNTPRSAGPFNGDGVTTALPFAFRVFAGSDLLVTKTTGTTVLPLTLATDYTVTLNVDQTDSPGGTVTLTLPNPVGSSVSIVGNLPFTQTAALPQGGNYSAIVVQNALDRATMLLQQIWEKASRSLRLTPGETTSDLPPAGARAGLLMGFDALGNPTVTSSAATAALGFTPETQTAGFGQTVFNLTQTSYTPGGNNIAVFIDGLFIPSSDYVQTNGTTVTFPGIAFAGTEQITFLCGRLVGISASATGVSMQLPGTLTAIRTPVLKGADQRSINDYVGADPTGATLSATAAANYATDTQAQIWAEPKRGRETLRFDAGVYQIDALQFTRAQSLKGRGRNSTVLVLKSGTATSMLKQVAEDIAGTSLDDTNHSIIEDMTLVGNAVDQVTPGASHAIECPDAPFAIGTQYAPSVQLRNLEIRGFTGDGLKLGVNRNWALIDQVIVRYCNGNAFTSYGYDHRVTSSDFGQCLLGAGLNLQGGGAHEFFGCNIYGNLLNLQVTAFVNAYVDFFGCAFDLALHDGALIAAGAGPVSFHGGRFMSSGQAADNTYADLHVSAANVAVIGTQFLNGATGKLPKFTVQTDIQHPKILWLPGYLDTSGGAATPFKSFLTDDFTVLRDYGQSDAYSGAVGLAAFSDFCGGVEIFKRTAINTQHRVPALLQSYAKAALPTAASHTGGLIYVTDDVGGATPAFSDGAAWRRVADRNVIS